MANTSLPDFTDLINQQVAARETLNEHLLKAEALTHVAMTDDFIDYPRLVVYHYLWLLSDLLEQAKLSNEHSLKMLLDYLPVKLNYL